MNRSTGRPTGWSTEAVERGLAPWIDAGIVGHFEIQLVAAVARAASQQPSNACLLALALAARATRLGHVCLDLGAVRAQVIAAQDDDGRVVDPLLPDPSEWRTELADSPIVTRPAPDGAEPSSGAPLRPLVLDGHRLYLQRFWSFEVEVAAQLAARSSGRASIDRTEHGDADIDAALDAVFSGASADDDRATDLQFVAARRALTQPVTVLAGGPGTGKTYTVARILASAVRLAEDRGQAFRIALAAPTGKAATRMREAVESHVDELVAQDRLEPGQAAVLGAIEPTTIHRLLVRKNRTTFRHDRGNPLLHDLVIIDETSMVSLPLLARLLDAVRPDAATCPGRRPVPARQHRGRHRDGGLGRPGWRHRGVGSVATVGSGHRVAHADTVSTKDRRPRRWPWPSATAMPISSSASWRPGTPRSTGCVLTIPRDLVPSVSS